jgi:hypothetical protein
MSDSSIDAGFVYHVRLTEKHSINTQNKDYRDKFVVVIGKDDDSYFGVMLINTKLGFPETEQYELKCSVYTYFSHNSFVNCSQIKCIDSQTMMSGKSKGRLSDDDFDLIRECAKNSRLITTIDKKRYGLI